MGTEFLTGGFNGTLDEKGRISLPAQLRRILDEQKLTLTQCQEDGCLWLFTTTEYTSWLSKIQGNTNPLSKNDRDVKRRFFNSHSVEVDKAGRIPIIQNFRDFAGLTKNCVILGQGDYIEIWDEERYKKYLESSEENFEKASEELGQRLMQNRGTV